jgi:hypothetical protein
MTHPAPPHQVLIRDLLIFQLKLWLDGLKDIILSPVSIAAAALDLLLGPTKRGPRLYTVLRIGERFDLWLNLFGGAASARRSADGLFAGSHPGDGTMLGALEGLGSGGRRAAGSARASGAERARAA